MNEILEQQEIDENAYHLNVDYKQFDSNIYDEY